MNCPSTQKSSRWLEPGDNSRTHILSFFHIALLTTLKPRFRKRPCPAESQILKGAGERKDHKPTAHAEVTEFSLHTHTHTHALKPRRTCKPRQAREATRRGERRTEQSLPLRAAQSSWWKRWAGSAGGWREAAGPAERERAQPALRSCPSQIFQLWHCSQGPAHA